MRIDQLVPPHQGRRGKDIVVLDRWGEDRTEDADEAQWLTVVDKGADGQTSVRQLIQVRFSRLETVV